VEPLATPTGFCPDNFVHYTTYIYWQDVLTCGSGTFGACNNPITRLCTGYEASTGICPVGYFEYAGTADQSFVVGRDSTAGMNPWVPVLTILIICVCICAFIFFCRIYSAHEKEMKNTQKRGDMYNQVLELALNPNTARGRHVVSNSHSDTVFAVPFESTTGAPDIDVDSCRTNYALVYGDSSAGDVPKQHQPYQPYLRGPISEHAAEAVLKDGVVGAFVVRDKQGTNDRVISVVTREAAAGKTAKFIHELITTAARDTLVEYGAAVYGGVTDRVHMIKGTPVGNPPATSLMEALGHLSHDAGPLGVCLVGLDGTYGDSGVMGIEESRTLYLQLGEHASADHRDHDPTMYGAEVYGDDLAHRTPSSTLRRTEEGSFNPSHSYSVQVLAASPQPLHTYTTYHHPAATEQHSISLTNQSYHHISYESTTQSEL
jgi:hypothetical protein